MLNEWTFWAIVVGVADIIFAIGVTIHAVLWKRNSRAVIAWVGLAWLAPLIGGCLYVCLGINRIERKAVKLDLKGAEFTGEYKELRPHDQQQVENFRRDHPNLIGLGKAGNKLTGLPALPGNRIEPLVDGDGAYPVMLEAIAKAEKSISFLSYIFDSDRAGNKFLDELVKAQGRGVEVRVLIDDVGSKYSRPNMVRQLQAAGVNAKSFLPTRIPRLPVYANLRNHRKILVVDGKVAFTGGTNIREGHCLKLDPEFPVQCLHFRLEGPVVAHLQKVFVVDWAFAAGETLCGDEWFPKLIPQGTVWARGVEHGPDEKFEKMADLIVAAIATARQRIRIVTPYFLPNESLIQALNVASMRDVEVEIYLPSECNIRLVQWAATAQLWQLLQKGCKVYYTANPFDHTKLMIVDDVWALIGSTNWDPRSLRLNFEFNVECFSKDLASELNNIVDKKATTAREVTLEEVNSRPFFVRLRDGLARLLTPYL